MPSPFSLAVLAFGFAGGLQPAPHAQNALFGGGAERGNLVFVGGDCSQAAAQVVDQTGGQLLSAQPSSDGQTCVITVLVQGDGASRPRKIRVQVPM